MKEMMEWYGKHEKELQSGRRKRRGFVPMKEKDYMRLAELNKRAEKKE